MHRRRKETEEERSIKMANAVILHLVGVGWAAASLGAPDAEPQSSLVPITTATRCVSFPTSLTFVVCGGGMH